MEWAKQTAKNATNVVMDPVKDPGGTANAAKDTTKDAGKEVGNQASEAGSNPGNTASKAYNKAKEYVPDTAKEYIPSIAGDAAGKAKETTNTASIINTPPFNQFKPDPSIVWKGFIIYSILAAGCTLPWWAFVTAADYFQFLYPGTHIIRLFAFAYFGPWLIAHLLVAGFWREGSSWVKINLGISVSILALCIITLLDGFFMEDRGTRTTFGWTLALVAISGAADAVSQGSLLGISSELPESFTKAYSCGAVGSGVFMLILRVITKSALNDTGEGLRVSGIIYFSIAAFFLALVLGIFAFVHYMPVMSYYNSLGLGSFETVRLLVQDEGNVTIEVAAAASIAAVAAGRSSPAQPLTWGAALSNIIILAIAVLLTTSLSLSLFPGFLAEDVHLAELGSWSPVLLLGTYIVADFAGRLSTITEMTVKHSKAFGLSFARLFIPVLFIFAMLFDPSVLVFVVLTAVLGFSNGYLISTLTVLVPKANPAHLAETAGILNSLIMNLGVLIGAGLSWIWLVI